MTDNNGRALHARLLGRDPVATGELAERYLDLLVRRVRRARPGQDDDLYQEAAETALLALIKEPETYDPGRSSLETYLVMSAKGDLLNLISAQQRLRKPGEGLRIVALADADRETSVDEDVGHDPAAAFERAEDAQLPAWLQHLIAEWTPQEREVLDLMHHSERRTERYAGVLGILHLAPAQQREEVKRVKDRLMRRFHRAAARTHALTT